MGSALPPTHVSLELLSGNVNCGQLPELDKFSVKQKFLVPNVNIPLTAENKPEIYGYQTGSNWVGRFEATLDVTVGGSYTFALDMGPADTAFLWLDHTHCRQTSHRGALLRRWMEGQGCALLH